MATVHPFAAFSPRLDPMGTSGPELGAQRPARTPDRAAPFHVNPPRTIPAYPVATTDTASHPAHGHCWSTPHRMHPDATPAGSKSHAPAQCEGPPTSFEHHTATLPNRGTASPTLIPGVSSLRVTHVGPGEPAAEWFPHASPPLDSTRNPPRTARGAAGAPHRLLVGFLESPPVADPACSAEPRRRPRGAVRQGAVPESEPSGLEWLPRSIPGP